MAKKKPTVLEKLLANIDNRIATLQAARKVIVDEQAKTRKAEPEAPGDEIPFLP